MFGTTSRFRYVSLSSSDKQISSFGTDEKHLSSLPARDQLYLKATQKYQENLFPCKKTNENTDTKEAKQKKRKKQT